MSLAIGCFLVACALLAWSGAGKLARPSATRAAARAIGAPSSTAAVRALGALELGAAVAGAMWGGPAALLVASVYCGLAVAAFLLVRRAPDTPCGCLGASDTPASRTHVGLNLAAAAVAVIASFGGPPLAQISGRQLMVVTIVVEAVVLALLTVLVFGLLRSHADILRRLHAIDPDDDGAVAPARVPIALNGRRGAHDISGVGVNDSAAHIAIAATQHRTLVAFLSSGCLTCRTFWDAFADVDALDLPPDVRLVVVAKDPQEESVSVLRELAPAGLPVVLSSAAWEAYAVPGSPYFVLVDGAAGRVEGEGTGTSWPQVRNLIVSASDDTATAPVEKRASIVSCSPTASRPVTPSSIRMVRPSERSRCRGGVRARVCGRDPQHVVALRSVDAHEHQPARGAGPEPVVHRHREPRTSRRRRSPAQCSARGWAHSARRWRTPPGRGQSSRRSRSSRRAACCSTHACSAGVSRGRADK